MTKAEAGLRWLDGETANIQEARNSLALIVKEGNRAGTVIRQLREFVKTESGVATPLDIREIIRETIALMKFDFEKNRIALTLIFPDSLPLVRV